TRRLCEVVHTCLAWGTEMVGGGSEEIVGEIGMRGLAKQPPDAAASHHHEQNRQCNCRCKHCNYCCERKDVHNAIRKCEKYAFPLDGKKAPASTFGWGKLAERGEKLEFSPIRSASL